MREGGPKILQSAQKKNIVKVLFTYATERNPKRVYLAGTFNSWAENQSGEIKNPEFAMEPDLLTGNFFSQLILEPKRYAYKFVEEGIDGKFEWFADPFIDDRDKDGNSVVNFKKEKTILSKPDSVQFPSIEPKLSPVPENENIFYPAKAYYLPGEEICFVLQRGSLKGQGAFKIKNIFGKTMYEEQVDFSKKLDYCSNWKLPEGGYIAQLWNEESELLAEEVTSVISYPSDDVRYGFYATWDKVYSAEDYLKRGRLFLKAHINAVQFYDWFPAHGNYTPDTEVFEFEPFFGKKLFLKDIEGKIAGLKKYRIAPLAYVAPYAASESVYKKFNYPMRYEDGKIRVFSEGGIQESQDSARTNGRQVWFYLMSIDPDSPWRKHILNELAGALRFGFEGFHVDSYGHGNDEKYFSSVETSWNKKKMSTVLSWLVQEITNDSHKIRPQSLVTFNSVSGFALKEMCDKEDFAFVENWAGHSSYLEDLAEMVFNGACPASYVIPAKAGIQRSSTCKRLVVAVYPKDSDEKPDVWDEKTLRLILGATQSGGGSLIVLGEPIPAGPPTFQVEKEEDIFNSLSDLYYPNHKPLPAPSVKLMHDFFHFDQMMAGLTHGKDVLRREVPFLPHAEVSAYEFRKGEITAFTLLRMGENKKWTEKNLLVEPLKNVSLGFASKASKAYFATPEDPSYRNPVEIPFSSNGKNVWVQVPFLQTFGVVILVP